MWKRVSLEHELPPSEENESSHTTTPNRACKDVRSTRFTIITIILHTFMTNYS